MLTSKKASIFTKGMVLLTAVYFLSGCASNPVPPVFNLYGYHTLAIVPFDNPSQDPALNKLVEDAMAQSVVSLNAVPVMESSQVNAFLMSLHAKSSDVALNADLRGRVSNKFNADLLMVGTVDSYEEYFSQKDPQRLPNDSGVYEWGFFINRKVVINFTAKIINPSTGALLWSQKAKGWSYFNKWNQLPIPGDVQVPSVAGFDNLVGLVNTVIGKINAKPPNTTTTMPQDFIPNRYKFDPEFASLRQKALNAAVEYAVGDFQGHYGWAPEAKAN